MAAQGYPVFRFDRRGVGDSSGRNRGFTSTYPDISAALSAFREQASQIERVGAYGNCDAATALMQFMCADSLMVSNPWVLGEDSSDVPPPRQAIRKRYAEKLKDPRELWRLLSGNVSLRKLARGLGALLRPKPAEYCDEANRLYLSIKEGRPPVRILLADADRTAQHFAANWPENDTRLSHCPGADHAFSDAQSRDWLREQLVSALHEQARQLDMG